MESEEKSTVDPSLDELADPEFLILDDVDAIELLFLWIPRLRFPPNPLAMDMDWLRDVVEVYWLGELVDNRLSKKLELILEDAKKQSNI